MIYDFVFDPDKLDEYKRGLITGVMYMATGKPQDTYAWAKSDFTGRWYKILECTEDQLKEVVSTIEHLIPGAIVNVD